MRERERTPWAVRCRGDVFDQACDGGELIFLTKEEYDAQLNQPDRTWRCPFCKGEATWDDENYEKEVP